MGSFALLAAFTVSPTVYAGDSSLLTAASFHMGSAHPPGYPLFNMLGRLGAMLPFGNVAMRVNMMSALFGALVCLMAYESAALLAGSKPAGAFAALSVLGSTMFVLESSKAEVYTLNAFFMMLIFFLCLKALRQESPAGLVLISSFAFGLGMANHHTLLLFAPLVVFALVARRNDLPGGTIILSLVLFFSGIVFYLYLLIRSTTGTLIDYLPVRSLENLMMAFLRVGYSVDSVQAVGGIGGGTLAGWLHAVKNIFIILGGQMHPLLWALVAAGLASSFSDRTKGAYISLALLVWVPLARITIGVPSLSYREESIIGVYYLPLVPLMGVLAASGLWKVSGLIGRRSQLVSVSLVSAFFLFQGLNAASAVGRSSLSDYYISYTWIKDVSKVLNPKSFYMVFGDNPAFLSMYGFGVERLRDDVLVMDSSPGGLEFRLTVSPITKFSPMYPEFYREDMTSVRYFFPIAEDYRLFSSTSSSVPGRIRGRFDVRDFVLLSIALPRENDFPYEKKFDEAFGMIDYLPVVIGHRKDLMTEEINEKYSYAVWLKANLLREKAIKEGDFEEVDYYFNLAYLLGGAKRKYATLMNYIDYLVTSRGIEKARAFMDEIKRSAEDEKDRENADKIRAWFVETYINNDGEMQGKPRNGT